MSRIIGIDLGTSTSEVSCVIDGKPVIIPNSLGNPVTPSVVHIAENGDVLVGEPASEYLTTRPECTFMEVKRLTGSGSVLKAHNRVYLPEDVQAMLLKYLAKCASDYLGEEISRAVITVPAYFTDAQRRATVEAGRLAGLEVCRVINEPTAAALDYGLMNLAECKNILVYDFGGGTLDVTVLELFEGVIDVKASNGNNHLGGKDFDETIIKHLSPPHTDQRGAMRLKKAAEECKIALSENESHEIALPFLAEGRGGRPVGFEKTVTRADFEAWVKEMIESTKTPMLAALADAGLSSSDIDIALLVGGSTRIPCVTKLVGDTLGIQPRTIVDPELTVARGAAIQAAILEGRLSGEWEIVLSDVCPYTLGAAVLRRGPFEETIAFDPIIPRNITIPAEKSKIYFPAYDYQTQVIIKAYQGESTDPDKNEYLGEVSLRGIPAARRSKEPIEVTFSYDMNGILQVKARVVSTGKEVSAEINTAGTKPKPAVDLSKWTEHSRSKHYRPVIRKAEKLIAAGIPEETSIKLIADRLKESLVTGDESGAEDLRAELIELMDELE